MGRKAGINRIEIDGELARIFFPCGKFSQIDTWDLPRVSMFYWKILKPGPRNNTCYAYARITLHDGKRTSIMLHRLILSFPASLEVDHIDSNGLNNTRENLRSCTASQNVHWGRNPKSKTGYMGVYVEEVNGKTLYRAQIRKDYKLHCLGRYKTPQEAHEKYLIMAEKLFNHSE